MIGILIGYLFLNEKILNLVLDILVL